LDKIKGTLKFISSNKEFLLVWLAQICSQSAVSIIAIIVGILSDEGTLSASTEGSAVGISIIISLSMLPGLFVAPVAGVLADWYDKKKIMILSDLIRFVLLAIFVVFTGWENLWLSYTLIFLLSVVLQFFIPAEGGLIPRLVGKKHILFANSLFSFTVYSTMAIGLGFSGLILNVLGIRGAFIICALLYVISTFFLINVKTKDTVKVKKSITDILGFLSSMFSGIKEGVGYLFETRLLRFAITHLFLLQVTALTLVTMIFRIGNEVYGVSPRSAGVVVFAPMVLGLVIGLATLNIFGKGTSRVKLILYGTFFSAIGFGFMSVISVANGILSRLLIGEVVATLALTSSLASFISIFIALLIDWVGDLWIGLGLLVCVNLFYSVILSYILRKRLL
jgi:MFS family permease